jgi:hypothetical protein
MTEIPAPFEVSCVDLTFLKHRRNDRQAREDFEDLVCVQVTRSILQESW